MDSKIEEVLDTVVRPYLAQHGGNIEFVKVENGIVEVKLLGGCSGCPSGRATIEEVVEVAIKEAIPEVKKVVLADPISEDMWMFAKQILKKNEK